MANSGLTATVQEILEWQREEEWARAGVPRKDIEFSRLSGMDARDVKALREFVVAGILLIVIRCPKVTARAWHGLFPPKSIGVKDKSGPSGLVVREDSTRNRIVVSDYDLMSVWRGGSKGFEKIFISAANGAPRGKWTPEALKVVKALNNILVSKIQHGCQDDFDSPANPGVKPDDHFAAFRDGQAEHLKDPSACRQYYELHHLAWPYDGTGRYVCKRA
jgi:hypothetical protein